RYDPATGSWSPTNNLSTARFIHTATLLPDGTVLVVGGYDGSGYLSSAERYDPTTDRWSPTTGSLATARYRPTATLLPDGTVLVVGGYGSSGVLSSAERYDPATGSWSDAGSLASARYWHTATLLASGQVLVVGGYDGSGYLSSAERYDPASGSWSDAGSLASARDSHTATLLASGQVLVVGGRDGSGTLSSAELYDPASGSWSATGSLASARYVHTATLLPDGTVLVVGGIGSSGELSSAELYDPATGSWSATGSLASARYGHTATLLPDGQVLVVGGLGSSGRLSSAEVYDPATGLWSATGSLASARYWHTATLLASGQVLVVGGIGSSGYLSSAERYDVGLGFDPTWRPTITTAPITVASGPIALSGSGFRGISEASSGGANSSATGYPLVQLRALDGGLTRWLSPDPAAGWSDTSFTSQALGTFPDGYALLTVFVNAIPSQSVIIQVDQTAPTVSLTSAAPNPTNASPIPVTATFSEGVTGFTVDDIVAGNATVSNFVAVSATVYTFDLTPAADGAVTADIAAGVATDAAGNSNSAATQLSRTYSPVAPITRIYLSLVMVPTPPPALPDLVVAQISTAGGQLSVTIANQGAAATSEAFWVDLLIAPTRAPTQLNDTWDALGTRGLTWGVTAPLAPGARITLTVGDAYYRADYSNPGGPISAGTLLYAHVDSASSATTYGGVRETHERDGGPYNNILGPVPATTAVNLTTLAGAAPAAPAADLPPR
ncbi:hypothetical protein K2Z83_10710, partial [Oscillochloris sp. ZM17-4]|uniref:kelch repeat-containing protein n=1 Tax=Oscillochloris sp. ZM17-4 TaxID=2866714 RepID=UPI001C73CB45